MQARRGPCAALVIAVTVLAGCAHQRIELPARAGQVRVDVTDVVYDHSTGTHYIVLEEQGARRVLPITIGDEEARAIMFELHGIKPERPLTYQLLLKVIQQTGNRIDDVVIGEVHDEVYYAKVYLDHRRYAVDSRPSDAIALAIGANVPIFVADRLFQATTAEHGPPPLATADALGLTVQELTPELAQYFGVADHSGVLIADIGTAAQKAGLRRGDIITQVNARAVASPGEFRRAAASVHWPVTLTVARGPLTRMITLAVKPTGATP